MPYYLVPQVRGETRDELGVVVASWVEPQLGGGLAWRGDTDGVNYLVFVDVDVPGRTALTPAQVTAEVQRRATAKGRPVAPMLADYEKLSLGRVKLPSAVVVEI